MFHNRQFINDEFKLKHKPTVQEMYQRKFRMGNKSIVMEIEDTSGMFAFDFPAMVGVSLRSVDAVLIVFSVTDRESFNQVGKYFVSPTQPEIYIY